MGQCGVDAQSLRHRQTGRVGRPATDPQVQPPSNPATTSHDPQRHQQTQKNPPKREKVERAQRGHAGSSEAFNKEKIFFSERSHQKHP